MRFVVCMENTSFGDFSADDLTIGRLYEVIGEVDTHQMLRIIGDSGEDYLYPAKLFEQVGMRESKAERLRSIFSA